MHIEVKKVGNVVCIDIEDKSVLKFSNDRETVLAYAAAFGVAEMQLQEILRTMPISSPSYETGNDDTN